MMARRSRADKVEDGRKATARKAGAWIEAQTCELAASPNNRLAARRDVGKEKRGL